jgi:hypothetical protein
VSTPETGVERASDSQSASRGPRISEAEVFRAADALLFEEHRPTIDRVRMRLGRGSPNKIGEYLDQWWPTVGRRLRTVPGQGEPGIPDPVGEALRGLWSAALVQAEVALRESLATEQARLNEQRAALENRGQELEEREQAARARATAIDEALGLAREQLRLANERTQALERRVHECETENTRCRRRIDTLDAEVLKARATLDAATIAHQTERGQLQERHAESERHWLLEVDRARQGAKAVASELEQQTQAWHRQREALQQERDQLRQDLAATRAECQTANAVREQLEQRLRAATPTGSQPARKAPNKPHGATPGARRGKGHTQSTRRRAK